MIRIFNYGIEMELVSEISHNATKGLADLAETTEDDINFIALESEVFHKGESQQDFYALIEVELPHKYHHVPGFSKNLVKFLKKAYEDYVIHFFIKISYDSEDDETFEVLDDDFPTYLNPSNMVHLEEEHHHHGEEIFEGDIFANYEEDIAKLEKEKEEK